MVDYAISFLDILSATLSLLFMCWPLLLISVVRERGNLLRMALAIWTFLALARVFLVFFPSSVVPSLLIPEPWNTIFFFVAGIVLLVFQLGVRPWVRRWLRRSPARTSTVEDLLALSPRQFEEAVVDLYRARGHRVKRTGAIGDHGVDVVVQAKNGEKWIIQCKRWRGSIGEPVVRDFYGTLHHEKADKGIIITTGTFTQQAQEWARGKPVYLCDGEEFLKLRERVRRERQEVAP
jgi:hypothetical protein